MPVFQIPHLAAMPPGDLPDCVTQFYSLPKSFPCFPGGLIAASSQSRFIAPQLSYILGAYLVFQLDDRFLAVGVRSFYCLSTHGNTAALSCIDVHRCLG